MPQKVRVYNQMKTPIWVNISENQSHIIETKVKTVSEVEFEQYYKMMVKGSAKVPIEGIPVDASYEQSSEFKTKLKVYWEKNQEVKFEWSGFIESGELEIAPGKFNNISLKADEQIYYISILTTGRTLANAVQRSENVITVDATGHINEGRPGEEQINNGMTVYFEAESNAIGDPQTANNGWDAGTFGNTRGPHQIQTWDGKELQQGVYIRISTNSRTLASDTHKYLYSSQIGNTYYDKKSDNQKQQWKISKIKYEFNSPGDNLYYGDQVKISNGWWPKANLGKKGKWLQCVNDEPTIWTLKK